MKVIINLILLNKLILNNINTGHTQVYKYLYIRVLKFNVQKITFNNFKVFCILKRVSKFFSCVSRINRKNNSS